MNHDHSLLYELWLHASPNIVACMKWHFKKFDPDENVNVFDHNANQLYEVETLHMLHFLNVLLKVDCEGSEDQFKQYDRKIEKVRLSAETVN